MGAGWLSLRNMGRMLGRWMLGREGSRELKVRGQTGGVGGGRRSFIRFEFGGSTFFPTPQI
jgi:hypothetical protein